jgi:hypothetical protein
MKKTLTTLNHVYSERVRHIMRALNDIIRRHNSAARATYSLQITRQTRIAKHSMK